MGRHRLHNGHVTTHDEGGLGIVNSTLHESPHRDLVSLTLELIGDQNKPIGAGITFWSTSLFNYLHPHNGCSIISAANGDTEHGHGKFPSERKRRALR